MERGLTNKMENLLVVLGTYTTLRLLETQYKAKALLNGRDFVLQKAKNKRLS